MGSLWLMYHDVYEVSRARSRDIPRTAAMYHVSADRFKSHLSAIARSGLHVTTVGRFLRSQGGENSIALTFDDGWAGAFENALPLLVDRGWSATFFITLDFLRRKGFCAPSMLLEAVKAGMEVGIHGTTHRMLSSCSCAEVVEEFSVCKEQLESLLGQAVEHASLPGGDLTRTVVSCAEEASIKSLCTSRPGLNLPTTSHYHLRRVAVRESSSAEDMARYCTFDLGPEKARWMFWRIPRTVLGMKRYSRLRRFMLNEKDGNSSELFKP
jgi:peptidoglycan/xylan/chitin deacetylase (PgdA/CDA1 family)